MNKSLSIVVILLVFLLGSSAEVYACDKPADINEEVQHCEVRSNAKSTKSCCDSEDSSCNHSCSDSGCQCSSTTKTSAIFYNLKFYYFNNFKSSNPKSIFKDQDIKTGYISIWQPPKIS